MDRKLNLPGGPSAPLDVETLIELGSLLPDGFSLLDSSGIHVAVNDPFCEMVGYSREELVGSAPEQLYWPDEERETIRQALARTFDGQFGHFQLVFCRKNGERFPVVVSPNVVRGDDPAATDEYFRQFTVLGPHPEPPSSATVPGDEDQRRHARNALRYITKLQRYPVWGHSTVDVDRLLEPMKLSVIVDAIRKMGHAQPISDREE